MFLYYKLFCLFMQCMFIAPLAIFLYLQLFSLSLFPSYVSIVFSPTLTAFKGYNIFFLFTSSHFNPLLLKKNYSIISVTIPAPTVLPPSLIANLNPFSNATAYINSTSIVIFSPGFAISVPSGNIIVPVTSAVLM